MTDNIVKKDDYKINQINEKFYKEKSAKYS